MANRITDTNESGRIGIGVTGDDYDTDVRSYERRIREQEEYAASYLMDGSYERLLLTAGRLMALKEAMNEVHYQMEKSEHETRSEQED